MANISNKKLKQNLNAVLGRIGMLVDDDADFARTLAVELESFLDEYGIDDGFGTERQCDPRGDFRDCNWSIWGEVQ